MKKEILISGMKCEGCANRVKNALSEIEGIENIEVDLENKKATLETEIVSNETIKNAIEDLDFVVEEIK